MSASACASDVLPTPGSPSRNSGRDIRMARNTPVAMPVSGRYPARSSALATSSGDVKTAGCIPASLLRPASSCLAPAELLRYLAVVAVGLVGLGVLHDPGDVG